jgi:hypothetical protein
VSETLEQLGFLPRELLVREDANVVERGELRDLRDNIWLNCGRGRWRMLASLDCRRSEAQDLLGHAGVRWEGLRRLGLHGGIGYDLLALE